MSRGLAERLRAGDLGAAPAVCNLLENRSPAARDEAAALLAELGPADGGVGAAGEVVGI